MIGACLNVLWPPVTGLRRETRDPPDGPWVVADGDETPTRWEAGALGTATNNVAELTALERLLTAIAPDVPLEVRMDSQYAMKAVTTWLPGWKRKGWKTAAGKPVANQELVARIDELLTGRTVEFRYVPAHQVDGDRLNDFADRAASQAAIVQQPAGSDLGSPEPPASPDTPASSGASRRRPAAKTSGQGGSSRPGTSSRTIKAKFNGRCMCGRSYAAGEQIAKNAQGWGHPECRTAEPGSA
jgi:Ribonuclease HI